MPNYYYNPYNPSYTYTPAYTPSPQPQQSFQVLQQNAQGIIWVDGEVGAKAYQIPAGQTGPIALWDLNDTVIYLKSVNQMGIPNPLQKIRYTMEEPQNLSGVFEGADMSKYVTKDDLDSLKKELKELMRQGQGQNNQNGNGSQQNRSGR